MRWLVGLLLIANIAFLIWQQGELKSERTQDLLASDQSSTLPGLTLLSELEQLPPEREAPPPSCWKLGLFPSEALMMPIAERLAGENGEIIVHSRQIQAPPQYWLVLGPFENLESARQELAAIQKDMRIEAFVIQEGALKGAISLGKFRNGEAARRELARRKAQGFDAKLHTEERQRWQFGAEIQWPTLPPEEEALLGEISRRSKSRELPFIFLKKRCKSIASR